MRVENQIPELLKTKLAIPENNVKSKNSSSESVTRTEAVRENGSVFMGTNVEKSEYTTGTMKNENADAAPKEEVKAVRDYMSLLSNMMTPEDFAKMQEEGISLNNTEVGAIVTVVDKIQMTLASTCEEFVPTENISIEAVKSMSGNAAEAYRMAGKLKAANLPVTEDNLTDSMEAVKCADLLRPLTKNDIEYMVKNEKEPSIENIYETEHNGGGASYTAPKVNTVEDWTNIDKQLKKIIAGSEVFNQSRALQNARALVEQDIPVTADNLVKIEKLQNLTLPQKSDIVMDLIVKAMTDGKRPEGTDLSGGESFTERGLNALQVIQKTTDQHLHQLIERDQEITIQRLQQIQEAKEQIAAEEAAHISGTGSEGEESQLLQETDDLQEQLRMVTAKRQLEETRLMMTAEMNIRMMRKGISIETQPLEKLVEELKKTENEYYEKLMVQSHTEPTEENINLFKESISKINDLKEMPEYALGNIIREPNRQTVQTLHTEGAQIQKALEKASAAYEPLMTRPRKDMGDSIQKAFTNVEDILRDLDLDVNDANSRAVRILGYNETPVTPKNIMTIKEAHTTVNRLMKNMSPTVVLQMIKDGTNPLETEIHELNNEVDKIRERIGVIPEEKYSEFLWKLEKNGEIVEQERESFVGIYRLLHQVERTDGSVIGALVNQGADMTLKNLLMSVRTERSRGLDIKADEKFGGVYQSHINENAIDTQIAAGFGQNARQQGEDGRSDHENNKKKNQDYYESLLKQVQENIVPSKLHEVMKKQDVMEMSLEQFVDEIQKQVPQQQEEQAYAEEQVSQFEGLKKLEDGVIRMLTDYNQPVTVHTLLAANNMYHNRGAAFQKLESISKKLDAEKELEKAAMEVQESLTDHDTAEAAFEKFGKTAEQVLDAQVESEKITPIDLKELKLIKQELRLTINMARENSYEVPVNIGGELTAIRLKVISGTGENGKVNITFSQKDIGKFAAEFSVKDGKVTGYMASSEETGIQRLNQAVEQVKNVLEAEGFTCEKMDCLYMKDLDLEKFSEGAGHTAVQKKNTKDKIQDQHTPKTQESGSAELYRIAKQFVSEVKLWKNSDPSGKEIA